MHSVLRIDEILSHILTELVKKSDRRSMALVCKTFQLPALAELWRSLENLGPLIKLLGDGRSDIPGSGRHSRSTNADWSRWTTYDRHVQEIQSVTIESMTPGLLKSAPSLDDLLPGLKRATIWSSFRNFPALIRLISGRNLREIQYAPMGGPLFMDEVAPVADHCSFLLHQTVFSLTAFDVRQLQMCLQSTVGVPEAVSVEIQRSIAHAITAQLSLRSLKMLSILDMPFMLNDTARLPRLTSLDIVLWGSRDRIEGPQDVVPFELPPGSFHSLVDLSVRVHSSMVKQLDAILLPHCSSLRELHLEYLWRSPAPLLPESLGGLTRLEKLNVAVLNREHSDPSGTNWLAQGHRDLQVLTSLRQLRCVTLSLPVFAGPGLELIQSLAQAWPELQALSLTTSSSKTRHFPVYALQDLAHFAQHCPNLSFLCIPFTSHPPMAMAETPASCSEYAANVIALGMRGVILCQSHLDPHLLQRGATNALSFWPKVNVAVEVD